MKSIHKELASGKWFVLSFFEQMANIGSEIERTISWRKKGTPDYAIYYIFENDSKIIFIPLTLLPEQTFKVHLPFENLFAKLCQ